MSGPTGTIQMSQKERTRKTFLFSMLTKIVNDNQTLINKKVDEVMLGVSSPTSAISPPQTPMSATTMPFTPSPTSIITLSQRAGYVVSDNISPLPTPSPTSQLMAPPGFSYKPQNIAEPSNVIDISFVSKLGSYIVRNNLYEKLVKTRNDCLVTMLEKLFLFDANSQPNLPNINMIDFIIWQFPATCVTMINNWNVPMDLIEKYMLNNLPNESVANGQILFNVSVYLLSIVKFIGQFTTNQDTYDKCVSILDKLASTQIIPRYFMNVKDILHLISFNSKCGPKKGLRIQKASDSTTGLSGKGNRLVTFFQPAYAITKDMMLFFKISIVNIMQKSIIRNMNKEEQFGLQKLRICFIIYCMSTDKLNVHLDEAMARFRITRECFGLIQSTFSEIVAEPNLPTRLPFIFEREICKYEHYVQLIDRDLLNGENKEEFAYIISYLNTLNQDEINRHSSLHTKNILGIVKMLMNELLKPNDRYYNELYYLILKKEITL